MDNRFLIKDFIEKFSYFEKNIILDEDWEIWEACRYQIYYFIQNKLLNIISDNKKIKYSKGYYIRIIRECLHFIIKCIANRNKNILFVASRFIDKSGYYFDPNAWDIYELIKENVLVIDWIANEKGKTLYGSCINWPLKILKKIVKKKHRWPIYILTNIKTLFKISIPDELLNRWLNEYFLEKRYYYLLFKYIKPNRIFITQNGIQKGLFRAARDLNIPVIELQHGIVHASHIQYSLPKHIEKYRLAIPNFFLVFSEFWKDKIKDTYPVDKIIVSGGTVSSEIINHPIKYSVTFICSSYTMPYFIPMVRHLISMGFTGTICLKLHPGQIYEVSSIKSFFQDNRQVEVICNEISIKDIIGMSAAFVMIESTVAYEVLDANKPVYILTELSYEALSDIFKEDLVTLFSNADELFGYLKAVKAPNFTDSKRKYFEPFHKDRLLELL